MEVASPVQRWMLLLLLVLLAVLLVSAELPTDGELSVCNTPCCTVEPSCSAALHVACSCNDEERIVLRKGDIPPTVNAIHISNAERVTIYNDALTSLPLLTDFSLHGIVNVTIENGGMNIQSSSNLSMVRMEDIENVQVKSWAVTGACDRELIFELAKINQLQIETDAFHYDSETPGLKLMLQDINMLVLDSKAFSAPIAEMALNNVRMEECHDQSFGGRTANTMFNNVSIANAQTGCVFGSDSRSTLSVHSSRIDVLSSEAFSGQLKKLYINSSDFLTMQEIGVNLQLVELEVTNLFVQQLNSKALSVVADDSIRIHKMHVESLKKNALAGLLVKPTPLGFCPPVNIHQMEVTEAEPGSLTFSECADLAITDLIVHSMPTGLCPTEKLTRALCAGPDSGPLSLTQEAVFWQLYERSLCDQDDRLPFPQINDRRSCDCDPTLINRSSASETTDPVQAEQNSVWSYEDKQVFMQNQLPRHSVKKDLSDKEEYVSERVKNQIKSTLTEEKRILWLPPASTTVGGSVTDHQHSPMLYPMLCAVLSVLLVVVVVALLVCQWHRRRRNDMTIIASACTLAY